MAQYFANIEGTSLATSKKTHTTDLFKGKVSLVAMASFRSSEVSLECIVLPVNVADYIGSLIGTYK